ncbi:MAG: tRNA (adenosine(37)-N6)-threonylcarbamoyltransferase complex ATPase subunit type 1 TsaE [Peptoniphilaceae bacterium]|nr:tRNA (adenosine(37)-N6)-threonylcarbamoyltransferase complex ATPase subunit type 1 TsaE [Peptoniphilaceae bacterium]MDY6085820.1 tRNA (adenosine(37)-N6)-threonylcarbamoyltransferase complex ATPase subunit type 1 TsaE [Peptoniphilaceae bacterium]
MKFQTKEETRAWSEAFARTLRAGDVVALSGDLGAGKTQIVQWIAAALDAQLPAVSPTFSIVRHYPAPAFDVYHLDLYRLNTPEEIEDIDFETFFYPQQAVTLIEWADRAAGYLPAGLIHVDITAMPGEAREVETWRE